jgi:hypothetical protein
MTVVLIEHNFTPGKRGVCLTPYRTTEGYFKPCGKMASLHLIPVVAAAVDQYLARQVSLRGR